MQMFKKNIAILIPNATGPTNVGDQAILVGLLRVLNKTYKNPNLIIHSSEHTRYNNFPFKHIKPTLYSWAILNIDNPFERIFNLFLLLINYFMLKLNLPSIGPKVLTNLINDFKSADLILFVGGGFLRSQKGLTQSLN